MSCNEFHSVDEVLYFGIDEIMKNGSATSPRGEQTKEILGYSFKLLNPRARLINIKARNWSLAYALGELCWHLNASDKLAEIAYYSKVWNKFSTDNKTITASCYGKKIFAENKNGRNQWRDLVDLLRIDKDTRRAVLILNKEEDVFGEDVPCVTSIQFIARENKLNCITNMRSNDIIWGMCYDVFFMTFLQEMLAIETGLELGWYMHNASSYHLYDRHKKMAEKILNEGIASIVNCMDKLTDLEYLGEYLEIEKCIRTGIDIADERINKFPEYWRKLILPLKSIAKNNL